MYLENNSMQPNKEKYVAYVKRHAKKSPVLQNCFRAFWVGGLICAFGELLSILFRLAGLSTKSSASLVTITLICIAAFLTGVGIFDSIGKYAGAGTLVPVTGFANAVVAPAIDCKSEGLILGVGAKIFTVSGPVILYATISGCLFGVVYYFLYLLNICPT